MISKHHFPNERVRYKDCGSEMETYTVSIISFHTMRMQTVKSLVSFFLIQGLHGI